MAHYIDKNGLIKEIDKRLHQLTDAAFDSMIGRNLIEIKDFIDSLEVEDLYEQCVQYDSIKAGIQAHAETYSFNIESELFNQLTKEQQALWRKEIEQACISGGEVGYLLAKDPRYKENLEVKEADLEKELSYEDYIGFFKEYPNFSDDWGFDEAWIFAKYFYELGLKAQKGE